MALPLLLPAAKGLLGAGIKAGAKKALTEKAKSVAKDKVKSFVDGRKDRKKKRGALVKTESQQESKGGVLAKAMGAGGVSSIVKSAPVKVEEPNLTTEPSKSVGFEIITIKIDNINKIAGSIDKALLGQYEKELEDNKARKAAIAKAKRSKREALLEGGKKALGGISGTIKGVGNAFNFMDFIKNVLLGGILLFLVKNFQKILNALSFLRENIYIIVQGLRFGLKGFLKGLKLVKGFIVGAIKAPFKILKGGFKLFFRTFSAILKTGGNLIKTALRRVGDALFDFGAAALKRIKDLARAIAEGIKRAPGAIRSFLSWLNKSAPARKLKGALRTGGKFLRKSFVTPVAKLVQRASLTRVGNEVTKRVFDARLGLRQAGKKAAPIITKGKNVLTTSVTKGKDIIRTGVSKGREVATAVKGKVSPFLKRFIGEKGAKAVRDAAPAIKQMKGPLSKIKIPVIGPLITLVLNLLDPDVSAEEAIFKAVGLGIGEMAGTAFIPIPVVGTILGGIIGDYAGSLLYTLFRGGGVEAFQKRIAKDFQKALDVGGKAVDYIKNSIGRFYEGVPKYKLPGLSGLTLNFVSGAIDALPEKFPPVVGGQIPGAKAFKGMIKNFLKADKEVPDPLFFLKPVELGKLFMASFFPSGVEMPKFGTPKADAMAASSAATGAADGTGAPSATGTPSAVTGATVGSGDADLFQRLVLAESQGEGKLGMAAVARSVMNRLGLIQNGTVTPGTFLANDKTLRGVIYGPDQYQPTRDGSIDRAYSAAQKQSAQAAIDLAKDPDVLRSALIGAGVSENEANILIASTGFRTVSARYDASQDVNVVKFKNHLFNTAGNPGATAVQASTPTATPTATPTTPMVERYTSPSQEEAKAKRKLIFLGRATAGILNKKVEKKGDETKVIIPGLGSYMSGRNFFGQHQDKYFDENGNEMTEEVFMKNLENMENVQRGIMKVEKEKRETAASAATGTETIMGVRDTDEISGDPPTSGGVSDPSSVPTGTGLKDTISQRAIDVTYGTPSGPVRTRGRSGHHAGIDIGTGGQKGWYVAFKMKGRVSLISNLSGYGNTVIIEAGGHDFLFAHLARPSQLKQGQAYNGEIIGEIGNTGVGSGEHLHFEVRTIGGGTGSDVDPEPFTKHLVIGRMGDGSAVGTTTPSTLPQRTTGPTIAAPAGAGQGISGSPTARNVEQYPSYDDGTKNVLMIAPPGQIPQTRLPSEKRTARAQINASTSQVLNSYYKRQLLGLLYKVG